MVKLVATYAAGMYCVFTEQRSGMRQRAAIDIGDNTPTPEDMAKLAGQLADQWGWLNAIEKSPVSASKAIDTPKREYAPRDNSDPKPEARAKMILDWLSANPGHHSIRQVIRGIGLEDTDKRVGRWSHAFIALATAKAIGRELEINRNQGGLVRQYVYFALGA